VSTPTRPHIVIIGGGFAGIAAAREFREAAVGVTLIDRTNHHLFQPLLYQVATASLAPSDITVPIRWLLRNQRNATVLLGSVLSIDPDKREVYLNDAVGPVRYDYLVLATGSRHAYFGNDNWEQHAPGLKNLEDALEIRRRFLIAFEHAERAVNPKERDALMTFVIVGGGPTGVELAGTITEIAHKAMRRDFRRIDTGKTRVILLEGGSRLLPGFPESLSARATRDLESLDVEVRTDSIVTRINDHGVYIGDEFIAAGAVFWAAGNQASPLAADLRVPLDRAGRVLVEPDLSVPGYPEVFVAGDLAAVLRGPESWVPGVAPAANQEGTHAGKQILRRIRGYQTEKFRYFNKGDLATIGRNRAVAVFAGFKFAGYPAWLLWAFVHIMYLVGFRNRVTVLVQWAYAYATYQRGVRLITEAENLASPATGEWEVTRL
jgi:NADH dehydrogenase